MRTLILTLLLMTSSAFAKQQNFNFCTVALSESTEGNVTETFAAYLQYLKAEDIVSIETLKEMKNELEQNKALSNPVVNTSSSDYEIHYSNVTDYLTSSKLDHAALLKYLTQFLHDQEHIEKSKDHSREANKVASKKMKFNKVVMPNSTILMMDTHVTKKMWFDEMGEHPAHDNNNPFKDSMSDLPVTNITWWSAIEFANRLSIKENLEPVYKIDHLSFNKHKTAESGKLQLIDPDVINTPVITDTGGYRLPTNLEQEWIRSQRTNVNQQDWTSEKTKSIQPVAELEPYIIHGNKFYDLLGNVYEWSQDEELSPGRDITKTHRLLGGLCYVDDIGGRNTFIKNYSQEFGNSYIGLRLVRTVKEKKP